MKYVFYGDKPFESEVKVPLMYLQVGNFPSFHRFGRIESFVRNLRKSPRYTFSLSVNSRNSLKRFLEKRRAEKTPGGLSQTSIRYEWTLFSFRTFVCKCFHVCERLTLPFLKIAQVDRRNEFRSRGIFSRSFFTCER